MHKMNVIKIEIMNQPACLLLTQVKTRDITASKNIPQEFLTVLPSFEYLLGRRNHHLILWHYPDKTPICSLLAYGLKRLNGIKGKRWKPRRQNSSSLGRPFLGFFINPVLLIKIILCQETGLGVISSYTVWLWEDLECLVEGCQGVGVHAINVVLKRLKENIEEISIKKF